MQDPVLVFDALDLREGDSFMDMGCGPGDYSLHASRIVGDKGAVLAFDINESAIDHLRSEANRLGAGNLKAIVHDASKPLPLPDRSVDVCLISTVLHMVGLDQKATAMIDEVCRVIKPEGRLAIIECKKARTDFGPPESMRISPEEMEKFMTKFPFMKFKYIDLGFNYMMILNKF
jgi:ubiquinone/menaquinone biosynthesis C-methylase UbiE